MRFQPSLSGTLHLSRTNAFFMGGGKALVNAYYRSALALGVQGLGKSCFIYRQATLLGKEHRQIQRKAIRIVQLEGYGTINYRRSAL